MKSWGRVRQVLAIMGFLVAGANWANATALPANYINNVTFSFGYCDPIQCDSQGDGVINTNGTPYTVNTENYAVGGTTTVSILPNYTDTGYSLEDSISINIINMFEGSYNASTLSIMVEGIDVNGAPSASTSNISFVFDVGAFGNAAGAQLADLNIGVTLDPTTAPATDNLTGSVIDITDGGQVTVLVPDVPSGNYMMGISEIAYLQLCSIGYMDQGGCDIPLGGTASDSVDFSGTLVEVTGATVVDSLGDPLPTLPSATVPEPDTLSLFAVALGLLGCRNRCRASNR
jgi:hypothetical protein